MLNEIFKFIFYLIIPSFILINQDVKPSLKSVQQVDYQKIRQDIIQVLTNPQWDYGSTGPIIVRLAWHASGTYNKTDKTGGINGATLRFKKEQQQMGNEGIYLAVNLLEPVKQKNPSISYADLWVYASYIAIEQMGGPKIDFVPGRVDAKDDSSCPPDGRLPQPNKDRTHIRAIFNRMGFNDREMVALIGGGHALGKCHKDRSGYDGPWTDNPIKFNNDFFNELLDSTWTPKKWDGPLQYEDESKTNMMLPTDMEIRNDPDFNKIAQIYKKDQNIFFEDFAKAFKKLTELGFVQF